VIVPRFDLAVTGGDLARALLRLAGGREGDGGAVASFERQFAEWLGVRHARFVPSARVGLWMLLQAAHRVRSADRREVLIPAWTHASVPAVVEASGSTPRFLDCDLDTQNTPVERVPDDVWERAWAAIPTHLYGGPVDSEAWATRARAEGLWVFEDCAQALGARLRGRRVGTFADGAYFSFALTKNFTTLGGGMVATDRDDLAGALDELLDRGRTAPRPLKPAVMGLAFRFATRPAIFGATVYPGLRLGWKLTGRDLLHEAFDEPVKFVPPAGRVPRPHCAQALMGVEALPHLDRQNARRREIGLRLAERLHDVPAINLPSWREDGEPIFMSFMLRTPHRIAMLRGLLERGVDTSPGYLRACGSACPNATRLEAEQIHLPIYPRLSAREVDYVAEAVRVLAGTLPQPDDAPSALAVV